MSLLICTLFRCGHPSLGFEDPPDLSASSGTFDQPSRNSTFLELKIVESNLVCSSCVNSYPTFTFAKNGYSNRISRLADLLRTQVGNEPIDRRAFDKNTEDSIDSKISPSQTPYSHTDKRRRNAPSQSLLPPNQSLSANYKESQNNALQRVHDSRVRYRPGSVPRPILPRRSRVIIIDPSGKQLHSDVRRQLAIHDINLVVVTDPNGVCRIEAYWFTEGNGAAQYRWLGKREVAVHQATRARY
ncbi:hypothetical protein HYALB_00004613 [Hymenoscyphus albidus]|uniref:Uncharacterized protein n=1 Tax=Hymenoscyphus albidus TaxID=595503 RepID=A0A9N9Q2N8_9HELO|nr:hypothetical protein HYALB_00004613 [Hymenoscyphus albidus]